MLGHILGTVERLGDVDITVVAGYGHESVKKYVGHRASVVVQKEQLGTGHALLQADKHFQASPHPLLVLYGDTPLMHHSTIHQLITERERYQSLCVLLSFTIEPETHFGRIIRNPDGTLKKIVEYVNASFEEKQITEANAGAYCFDSGERVHQFLKKLKPDPIKKELYLTDIPEMLTTLGPVHLLHSEDANEVTGVNSRKELGEVAGVMQSRIQRNLIKDGVIIEDPHTTWIDAHAAIASGTVIHSHTVIQGPSTIAASEIGPFAHVPPNTMIKKGSRVRSFDNHSAFREARYPWV
jgi:bifunctional UDP-N-acetylglucosamine pyrophosphorylase/glucosamine-1-phosphate N-acetyltransferase